MKISGWNLQQLFNKTCIYADKGHKWFKIETMFYSSHIKAAKSLWVRACVACQSSPLSWILFLGYQLRRLLRWLHKSSSLGLHLFDFVVLPDHITHPAHLQQLALPSMLNLIWENMPHCSQLHYLVGFSPSDLRRLFLNHFWMNQ